jgi:hypothetical protein
VSAGGQATREENNKDIKYIDFKKPVKDCHP